MKWCLQWKMSADCLISKWRMLLLWIRSPVLIAMPFSRRGQDHFLVPVKYFERTAYKPLFFIWRFLWQNEYLPASYRVFLILRFFFVLIYILLDSMDVWYHPIEWILPGRNITNMLAGMLEWESKPDCSPVLLTKIHILWTSENKFYNKSGLSLRSSENKLCVTHSLYTGI